MQKIQTVSNILQELGRKLKALRKMRGMTQDELAEQLDVHPSYIGQIERGAREPSLTTINKIANTFNIPMEELLSKCYYSDKQNWRKRCDDLLDICSPHQLEAIHLLITAFLFRD